MTRSVFNYRRARALLSVDSFNRANQQPLGNTDGNGTLDPLTWTDQNATFKYKITGNAAVPNGSLSIASHPVTTVDLLTADVELSILIGTVPNIGGHVNGLAVRVTSFLSLLYAVKRFDGSTELWKRVAGTNTQLGSTVAGTTSADTLGVISFGSTVNVYRNGTLVIGPITETHNQTATVHGLFAMNPNASATSDNWQASAA